MDLSFFEKKNMLKKIKYIFKAYMIPCCLFIKRFEIIVLPHRDICTRWLNCLLCVYKQIPGLNMQFKRLVILPLKYLANFQCCVENDLVLQVQIK